MKSGSNKRVKNSKRINVQRKQTENKKVRACEIIAYGRRDSWSDSLLQIHEMYSVHML